MAPLKKKAADVRRQVRSAEHAVSTLESKAQKTISNSLLDLSQEMKKSSQQIEYVLERHEKRHWSLEMFQSRRKKAQTLERRLDAVLCQLDLTATSAARAQAQSESFYLQALDLPGSHIQPARSSLRNLRASVSDTQSKLGHDMEIIATNRTIAARRLTSVKCDIAAKEESIKSSQQQMDVASAKVESLDRQRAACDRARLEKLREAKRLREEAESRRTRGKIVSVVTLGIGVPYLLFQLDKANDCERDASSEEQRSQNLSSRISTLQSDTNEIEAKMAALSTNLSTLQSLKQSLDEDLKSQDRRVKNLEMQIRDIQKQVREAEALLHDAGNLDGSLNSLSTQVRTVQHQLLDMKQKVDGLKSTLEERRDRSTHKLKKAKVIDKASRDETMMILGEMTEYLGSLRTDVAERRIGVLAWRWFTDEINQL
ncbi:hypothetical protein B0H63DRAFT_487441 [Podospora didyma]|uniref:Uncharacterized protein n=1 Tax=Podospora didyma TaxID=330526 RepID=A0AAE0N566_9PEZI|nr:hypothetical protein B0H63DRAFT_487441 [Podospora didyma]